MGFSVLEKRKGGGVLVKHHINGLLGWAVDSRKKEKVWFYIPHLQYLKESGKPAR